MTIASGIGMCVERMYLPKRREPHGKFPVLLPVEDRLPWENVRPDSEIEE